jgi:hypothetical protein
MFVDASAGVLFFSDIFDLPLLRATLRRPIIEWAEIKTDRVDEASPEPLGCWSAWATGNVHERAPRYNTLRITQLLGLDVSYTALPASARRVPQEGGEYDWGLLFWQLAALIFPSSSRDLPSRLPKSFPSSKGMTLPPDTQVSCFDMLYFVTAGREDSYEWTDSWNPSWREVGKHIRFKNVLVELTQEYLRRVFRVRTQELPPASTLLFYFLRLAIYLSAGFI